MRDFRNTEENLIHMIRRKLIDGPDVKKNRLQALLTCIFIVTCIVVRLFFYSHNLIINIGAIYLLFGLSTTTFKKKKLFCITGSIAFVHLIIFPFIYLYFATNIPESFEFCSEVFDTEKTILQQRLVHEKDAKKIDNDLLDYLVKKHYDELSVKFWDISDKDSISIGSVVLFPKRLAAINPPVGGGGSGPIPYHERLIIKMENAGLFHEYVLDSKNGIFPYMSLIDIIKNENTLLEGELDKLDIRIKGIIEKNDIWTYENFLNYSIKIFLFDSPVTPHVGLVNQFYVLHLVLLSALSSMFFHELNKD